MRFNNRCVPGDVAALACAVHHRLVLQQDLTNRPTDVAKMIMRDLRNQMVGLLGGTTSTSIGAQVAEHLNKPNFQAFFTGDLYGPGCLKPYSVLVSQPLCAALREDNDHTGKILRYFFVRAAYESRRNYDTFGQSTTTLVGGGASSAGQGAASSVCQGGVSRETQLAWVLGINFAEFDEKYPEESLGSVSPDGFATVDLVEAQRRAQSLEWMPDPEEYMIMLRFVNMNGKPTSNSELGGVPVGMLRLGAALVVLTCKEESDWADKSDRTCKVNMTADQDATKELAQRSADGLYVAHYNQRLDEKRKKEVAAKRQAAIQCALGANSPGTFDEDFVNVLINVGITSSSVAGYADLAERLAGGDWPMRQRKIMTSLTGRNPDGDIVWANCNVCARIPSVFVEVVKEDATGTLMARVKLLRKKQGHVYSEHRQGTNRHGYNTDHPTLTGMGYDTFGEFEAENPEAAAKWFENRVKERLAIEHKKNRHWMRECNYRTLEARKAIPRSTTNRRRSAHTWLLRAKSCAGPRRVRRTRSRVETLGVGW